MNVVPNCAALAYLVAGVLLHPGVARAVASPDSRATGNRFGISRHGLAVATVVTTRPAHRGVQFESHCPCGDRDCQSRSAAVIGALPSRGVSQ